MRPTSLLSRIVGTSLLLATAPALAADPPPVPSDPVFTARTTDGKTLAGRIRRLSAADGLALVGDAETTLPLTSVVSLIRDSGDIPPAWPEGTHVLFPGGDRLRAVIGAADDTSLEIQPPALGEVTLKVPIESLLGVLIAVPSDSKAAPSLVAALRTEPRTSEILWLANGDRLVGGFLGLNSEKVDFQPDTGKVSPPRSGVLALGFDPAAARYPKPDGPYLEVGLADGSRLGLKDARLDKGAIAGTTRFGAAVRAPLTSIARIDVRTDAIASLADRKPAGTEFVGYLGKHPGTLGRNTTWDGRTLTLGGRPYDHGLGMLPRTLAAYRVEPGDTRFQAEIGLDDHAGDRADVVFRVLLDGKEKYDSGSMTRRDTPKAVDIDLAGGRLLILSVEFGAAGDVEDSADWVDARIIRGAEPGR